MSLILSRQVLAVAVGSLMALTACSKSEKEKEPLVSVQIVKAQRGRMRRVISAEAVLYPKNQAAITPKVNAPIKKFLVTRGAKVREGQLLAILENRDLA